MNFNPVVWFEIYVQNMPRAQAFYEQVLAKKLEGLILLEPLGGLEPSTRALRMRCSTTELQRRVT